MIFKPGQLVEHVASKSRWIVLAIRDCPHAPEYSPLGDHLLTAYCVYSGNNPEYWQPNQLDEWVVASSGETNYKTYWNIVQDSAN